MSEDTAPAITGVHHFSRTGDKPFPFATLVFRDPDNIQLELFTVC